MDINIFRKIIIDNELGGNLSLAYKFSDADGVGTGKSGYSFGLVQFDTKYNPNGILCLRECLFTTDEIRGIVDQRINIIPMNKKLKEKSDIVSIWDNKQLSECLEHSLNLCYIGKIQLTNRETLYHLADYHNQYNFSKNGKMYNFLKTLNKSVLPEDILRLKLLTDWGKKRPDDVHRRYDNIKRILTT